MPRDNLSVTTMGRIIQASSIATANGMSGGIPTMMLHQHEDSMKKLLAVALFASSLVPASAMALEQGAAFDVFVDYDYAGKLIPILLKDAGPQCLYVAEWYNQLYAGSEQCELLEAKTRAHRSCRLNAEVNFPSHITNGVYCTGWNDLGYQVIVEYMTVGENYNGFTGTMKFAGWYGFSSVEAVEI
jgi:hypothetical protein